MWRFEIAELKVWKGVDPVNAVYCRINLVCETYEKAKELMDYIKGNNPEREYTIIATA